MRTDETTPGKNASSSCAGVINTMILPVDDVFETFCFVSFVCDSPGKRQGRREEGGGKEEEGAGPNLPVFGSRQV